MAVLKGQEALDYIRNNPSGYKLVSGGQEFAPRAQTNEALGSGNFFSNLARSIFVDPFAKLGESAGVLTNRLLNTVYDENIGYDPVYDKILGDEATRRVEENPYLEGAKGAAGIAALAVPGGTGFKGGLKAGAAAGSLGGFGGSESQDLAGILGDTAMGAGAGGAIGGAVGGLSSLLGGRANILPDDFRQKTVNWADDAEAAVQRQAVGGPAPKKVGGALLEKESSKVAKEFGRTINTVDDLQNFSDELYAQYGGKIAQATDDLAQQGVTVSLDDALAPLEKQLASTTQPEFRAPLEKAIANIREAFGGVNEIPINDFYKLKQGWGKLAKYRYGADPLESAVASAYDDAYRNANDILRGNFKTNNVPGFDEANKYLSLAKKQEEWVTNLAAKDRIQLRMNDPFQDRIGIGAILGGSVGGFPGAAIGAGATYTANQTVSNPNVQRRAIDAVRGLAQKAPGLPSVNIPARTAPLAGLLGSQMIEGTQGTRPTEQAQIDPLQALGGPQVGRPEVDPQQELALLTLQLLGQTGDIGDASSLAELLFTAKYGGMAAGGGQEVATGEVARKALTAQQAGYEALAALQADPSVTGKTQGVENFFNSLTGAANSATDYNNKIETFRTLFMSALGGASLTPQEIERFEKSLPKVTDSPQRAQQKMESLLPYLDNLIYKGSGGSQQEDLLQMLGGY